jgi:hypothetical protein
LQPGTGGDKMLFHLGYEGLHWAKILQHYRIHFDQCQLGQVAKKSMALSWQGLWCTMASTPGQRRCGLMT